MNFSAALNPAPPSAAVKTAAAPVDPSKKDALPG